MDLRPIWIHRETAGTCPRCPKNGHPTLLPRFVVSRGDHHGRSGHGRNLRKTWKDHWKNIRKKGNNWKDMEIIEVVSHIEKNLNL
jgi:hypothetical protein